jgi:hypothetical protein
MGSVGRRATLQAYLSHDSSASIYSYLFATPTPGADAALGIYHASDIPFSETSTRTPECQY